MTATIVQMFGALLVTVGVGLWSLPAAFIAAGVLLLLFGVALERAGD